MMTEHNPLTPSSPPPPPRLLIIIFIFLLIFSFIFMAVVVLVVMPVVLAVIVVTILRDVADEVRKDKTSEADDMCSLCIICASSADARLTVAPWYGGRFGCFETCNLPLYCTRPPH